MIAALALAALSVTYPIDTGWHQATIDYYYENPVLPPTFYWTHQPAPAWATSATLSLWMEGDAWLRVENEDIRPHSLDGGWNLRNKPSYDRGGLWDFWYSTSGVTFQVLDLQPGEIRYIHLSYSGGPATREIPVAEMPGWLSFIKYCTFDSYRPVLSSLDGAPVNPQDYSLLRRNHLQVYIVPGYGSGGHLTPPKGRMHGSITFQ